MSATRREGPTLLQWIAGRFQYPEDAGRCTRCGGPGGAPQVMASLKEDLPKLAAVAGLCDACKRSARDAAIRSAR